MRALRDRGWVAACSVAIVLVALPATTAAKPSKGTLDGSVLTGFTLRGSDGYRIQVLTLGPRLVLLGASKGQVAAAYAVFGRIEGNRIKARFGNLGRISVKFVGRRSKGGRSPCEEPFELVEAGIFRGTIRFAGERGYTKVNDHNASGVVLGANLAACANQAASSAAPPFPIIPKPTTHLAAVTKKSGTVVSVDAVAFGGARRIAITGSLTESRGKMRVQRVASAIVGGKRAFVSSGVGQRPAFATVKPPKPFSGTGVFQENSPLSNSWTGSIAAWLPGAGRVSLAGPRFASSLCRQPTTSRAGCDLFPTVKRNLQLAQDSRPAQDSGSQSQALRDVMLSWSRYLRNSSSSAGSTP
ncbi:MAG: hypothetical protein WD827_04245 [Solirubrobacterales bacterium]